MKVLVVSDTHRHNENYLKLLNMHHPDMVIHCGDVEGSEYVLTQAADCPVHMVKGNNDFFSELPRELELEIGPYKVWVTHGHNYGVSASNGYIRQEAIDRGMDIVIYGHTHIPLLDQSGEVVSLNPGSIAYPRQAGRIPSYAIIEDDRFGEWHFHIAYLK